MNLTTGQRTVLGTICVMFFFALATTALADPTAACHCFKNRTYNPTDKFAADDYLLATSFNSLIAKVFALPKREVVLLKMQGGVDENDLLVGLHIAAATKVDLPKLLALRQQKKSWQQILASQDMGAANRNDPLLAAIKAGIPDVRAGQMVGDGLIARFYGATTAEIAVLRASGLKSREIALLFLLARTSAQVPQKIAALRSEAEQSWGEIAADLGIEPAMAGKLVNEFNPPERR